MQLNFLQEDLLVGLEEPGTATSQTPGSPSCNPASTDLFAGLPTATTRQQTENPPTQQEAGKLAEKPAPATMHKTEKTQKAETAFKTISEAAAILEVPQHVLRFWESRFSQVRPLKMGGGRRYYRPEDIDTLSKIRNLLYKQGYTIKGAKKAFGLKDKKPAEITAISPNGKAIQLKDKDKKQVSAIRQELIGLREVLRPYLSIRA